jgi:hypothetical protein
MKQGYLDALPEVANKYGVDLEAGEKPVFAAELKMFGTETDRLIGGPGDCNITLTNKYIFVSNGVGLWSVDVLSEVVSCVRKIEGKIFKNDYAELIMNKEIVFDSGRMKLNGFHFYFKKKDDAAKFDEIMTTLLS